MKTLLRLIVGVAFALASVTASAQESHVIPVSLANIAKENSIINGKNAKTCQRLSLAIGCTQAQACTAASAAGGASCTAAQARAAKARIWLLTQPGREEYTIFGIVEPAFDDQVAAVPGESPLTEPAG